MAHLEVIAYWSPENSRFIAEVPQLPGWAAEGNTYQEAVIKAQKMLDEWASEARFTGAHVPKFHEKMIVV